MKPTGQDLLNRAKTLEGKPYIYGYEVRPSDPTPEAADCSELVEWTCLQEGVVPKVPDGARNQYHHCDSHGLLIDIADALTTPGALLFIIEPENEHYHVAFSRGDGETTFEARGRRYKIGVHPAHGRGWTAAGLIPGVKYPGWEIEDD